MPKKKSPDSVRIRNSAAEFLTFAYQTGGDGVEVRVQDGTIWLSQKNIGQLFETTPENVLMHLKNIFAGEELAEDSVAKVFLATATDGKNYRIKHYNLDAIIAGIFLVAVFQRANGATYDSPGQRPGKMNQTQIQALKGRSNRCRNPSPDSTFTSFSAQKTANRLFPIPFAARFMPTWPLCFKTSVVFPCSSIQSKTTFICSSIYPARWQLAKRSRMSKSPLPSGSKPKELIWEVSRGKQDTERLPFPNRTSKPSANTSPASGSITARKRFRKNTANFSNETESPSMRNMYGIDRLYRGDWGTLSGFKRMNAINPRALPWAVIDRPVGAVIIESAREEQADE